MTLKSASGKYWNSDNSVTAIFINMLYYDILDEIAESKIPNRIHPELHVNSRTAWVETVVELIEKGHVKGSYENLLFYAKYWEPLLYKKYSTLN